MRPHIIVDTGTRWDDFARISGALGRMIDDGGGEPRFRLIHKQPPPKPPAPRVVTPRVITCPSDQHLSNGKCVVNVPLPTKQSDQKCPTGEFLLAGKCVPLEPVCPEIAVDCPAPGHLVYGPAPCHTQIGCDCPDGSAYNFRTGCQPPPPPPPPKCPQYQTWINGQCVVTSCAPPDVLENGQCVAPQTNCPAGEYPVDGVCQVTHVPCPGGYVDASGNCVPNNAPAPVNGVCPTGWQIDSAGYCTPAGSEANPYSLYLPSSTAAAPASDMNPAPPAGCPSGQFADSAGNCFPDTLAGWLQASTLWSGVRNEFVVGGALGVGVMILLAMHSGKKAKR